MTAMLRSENSGDNGKDQDAGSRENGRPYGANGRRKDQQIPTMEECLAALAKLNSAVALGLLAPSQANAIRANFTEILRHHQKMSGATDRKGVAGADVMELMRKDPKILSILSPFLSDEDVAMIMKNASGRSDGQA